MLLRFIALLLLLASLAACNSLKPPPTPVLSPLESRGRGVFVANCSRCHASSGETVIVGPSLAGVATRGSTRIEGMDAEAYIRDSILNPTAYTVEGFPKGVMPSTFKDELSPEQLDAVVAYLLTLK